MNIVKMLKKEAHGLEEKVRVLHRAIVILSGVSSGSGSAFGKPGDRPGRRAGWKMSAAARRKISLAQKARWKAMAK